MQESDRAGHLMPFSLYTHVHWTLAHTQTMHCSDWAPSRHGGGCQKTLFSIEHSFLFLYKQNDFITWEKSTCNTFLTPFLSLNIKLEYPWTALCQYLNLQTGTTTLEVNLAVPQKIGNSST